MVAVTVGMKEPLKAELWAAETAARWAVLKAVRLVVWWAALMVDKKAGQMVGWLVAHLVAMRAKMTAELRAELMVVMMV